jgi:predicted RNA-binding Zn-ribbon protein involved in translation (DUF1610 family)
MSVKYYIHDFKNKKFVYYKLFKDSIDFQFYWNNKILVHLTRILKIIFTDYDWDNKKFEILIDKAQSVLDSFCAEEEKEEVCPRCGAEIYESNKTEDVYDCPVCGAEIKEIQIEKFINTVNS